ncbi:MAG: PEP-CTERM sorting domain-containing protein [Motiliproteus sp.]
MTGADLWDAGTEALDINTAPFVAGVATDNPADSNTAIRAAGSLDAFAGLALGNGQVLDQNLIDFISNPAGFDVATITIQQVPEPVSTSLMLLGLLSLGYATRRRKAMA